MKQFGIYLLEYDYTTTAASDIPELAFISEPYYFNLEEASTAAKYIKTLLKNEQLVIPDMDITGVAVYDLDDDPYDMYSEPARFFKVS